MEEKKNQKGLVWLIVILIVLVLGLVGYIVYDKVLLKEIKPINSNTVPNVTNKNDDKQVSNNVVVLEKLKEVLTNKEWIKNNLYSKINCFGETVNVETQQLTFVKLKDITDNPFVIVLNNSVDDFILIVYKVYYSEDEGEVKIENITNSVNHPSHANFMVDKDENYVTYSYMHMGISAFAVYDVKKEKAKMIDEYKNITEGEMRRYEEKYNLSDIDVELNDDNVYKYLNSKENVENNLIIDDIENNVENIDNNKIEEAIKKALLENVAKDDYFGIWGYDNSVYAEGHKTLRTEFIDNKIYSYVLANVGAFTKENGSYVETSGMAGPFVLIFTSDYEFENFMQPESGEDWTESLKDIFPIDLISEVSNVNYNIDYYQNQIKNYLD